ncbi:unnamed protein product, partial [Adineta ricciae]
HWISYNIWLQCDGCMVLGLIREGSLFGCYGIHSPIYDHHYGVFSIGVI